MADDLPDDDQWLVQQLLATHTAQALAEQLVQCCGCRFDSRLPDDAPPYAECDYHRRLREVSER
jgi:hypothetical protein